MGSPALPTKVGEVVLRAGFFTQARYLRMQPASEVEARVGYRAGRLRQGWWLLFLLQMPLKHQFEYRGHSHMSDGRFEGHKPSPGPRAEQLLAAAGHNLMGTSYQRVGSKETTINETFTLAGHLRLAKVLPVAPEHGDPGIPDYPPGSGIPQWSLTAPLQWKVAALIRPGQVYDGSYV